MLGQVEGIRNQLRMDIDRFGAPDSALDVTGFVSEVFVKEFSVINGWIDKLINWYETYIISGRE